VLAHPPHSPGLAPCDYWLFACVKKHLRGKQFESKEDVNTAVTESLHCLSKDEYKAATDRLPHIREKSVDSVGDYIGYIKCVQTLRNIFSCV
jgi:histone-lysine N-methyltransferase SETMAR